MDKLSYDIKDKYSVELNAISEILNNLRAKRIYELSNVRSDGSIEKNINNLEEKLNELLTKIQNGESSITEIFAQYFK